VTDETDPGDPDWEDHRTLAERWRDDWAARARGLSLPHRGFVLRQADLVVVDCPPSERRRLVRAGIWWAPRRGVVALFNPGEDARVALALAATAAAAARPSAVISHESAAIIHGLPVLIDPDLPVLTAPVRNGTRGPARVHLTSLEQDERTDWYGAPVTTVARTVVDAARSGGPLAGLITADAALREGLTDRDALIAAVARAAGRPGNAAARWVAEHADPLSESPLESLIRGRLLQSGLPAPELQVTIPGTGARVDMLYREARLVIEADGLFKYTDAGVLRAEKLRQERVEARDYRVLRVTWPNIVRDTEATLTRVTRALTRRR
jgi:very-short-patch-repair endonuclease